MAYKMYKKSGKYCHNFTTKLTSVWSIFPVYWSSDPPPPGVKVMAISWGISLGLPTSYSGIYLVTVQSLLLLLICIYFSDISLWKSKYHTFFTRYHTIERFRFLESFCPPVVPQHEGGGNKNSSFTMVTIRHILQPEVFYIYFIQDISLVWPTSVQYLVFLI